jgi:hypothetical protein
MFLKIKKRIHKEKEDHYLHKETARKMINLPKLIVRARFTSKGRSMLIIMMSPKRLSK